MDSLDIVAGIYSCFISFLHSTRSSGRELSLSKAGQHRCRGNEEAVVSEDLRSRKEVGLSKLFILLKVFHCRVLNRPRCARLCSDKSTLTGQTIRATESPLHRAAPVIQAV